MIRLLIRNFKHQKGMAVLFIFALMIILILLPVTIHSLFDVRSQTKTDVSHYARGSYDILIRPLDSEQQMETKHDIVPENYIGFGNGGISLKQWEKIKNHPDVAIAAPVASLGYFTGMKNIYMYEEPEHTTRFTTQLFTSDGVNRFPVTKEYVCTLMEYDAPIG